MAFSSVANFIHFPPNPISKNYYNPATPLHTRNYLPPPPKRRASLFLKCNGGAEHPEKRHGNQNDPFETVNKLYKAINNKDIAELSEVIADQSPHVPNSSIPPFFRIFQAKLLMSKFFSHIIKALQNSLTFSVHPTKKDGSMVGLKWKVGWAKTFMKLEKGITIHSHHSYVGKLLIGNLETIMDPVLQLEPMRLMNMNWVPKQRRVASLCLGFFLLLLALFFFQFSVR